MRSSSAATVVLVLTAVRHTSAGAIEGLVTRNDNSYKTENCFCPSGPFVVNNKPCGSFQRSDNSCFCESEIPDVVASSDHPTITTAKDNGFDWDSISSALGNMWDRSSDDDKKTCTRPANAVPACSRDNICGYTCPSGLKDCGTTCAMSCPSGTSHKKRSLNGNAPDYWGSEMQRSCPEGWKACGIAGGGKRAWECVDVKRDLESCGGCPFGITSSLSGESTGKDCTGLRDVSDVACINGRCVVQRCLPGHKLSSTGHYCVEDKGSVSSGEITVLTGTGSLPQPFSVHRVGLYHPSSPQ